MCFTILSGAVPKMTDMSVAQAAYTEGGGVLNIMPGRSRLMRG